MAVASLTQKWVHAVLMGEFPNGVPRRTLLDYFAQRLVGPKSSMGAKGRLAGKLYRNLGSLTRKGLVQQDDGVVHGILQPPGPKDLVVIPQMDRALEKVWFLALMAEDRRGEDGGQRRLHEARQEFIRAAMRSGWDEHQVGKILGLSPGKLRHALAPLP